MMTGHKGIALIKEAEGFRRKAYQCSGGIWTIGYGHTAGVKPGDEIDEQKGEQLLREDLRAAEREVNSHNLTLRQNQFDALVSFVFNCGAGHFRKSTLLKCVKANPDNTNIAYEFSRWNKSKGVVLNGLIRRRRMESELYFSR